MTTGYIDYTELVQETLRRLEREQERLEERADEVKGFVQVMKRADEVLAENKTLQSENESLKEQLEVERMQRAELEMKLAEMNKLSAGMARKASEENLLKALRTYANHSKRKTADKRAFAKTALLDIANVNGLALPEDLAAAIECLDDEQAEPKVVNVTGNATINDIHNNSTVNTK